MTIKLPGVERGDRTRVSNYYANSTGQTPAATTRTYISGSALAAPPGGFKVGDRLRWTFNATKTAAGTASSTIDIAFGTTASTSDTAQVSFTKPGGSAAADEGFFTVEALVQAVSSSAGKVRGEFTMIHNLASTGHATIPCVAVQAVSSSFDNTGDGNYMGLCITTGASDAITINQVSAELLSAA